MKPSDGVWIGVDVGASKVAAYLVVEGGSGPEDELQVAAAHVEVPFETGFCPEPLEVQLAPVAKGRPIELAPAEREDGERRIEAIARCVAQVAEAGGAGRFSLACAAPGRRTADGRGLAVVRNGPRLPELCDRLEQRLIEGGFELSRPVATLVGDDVAGAHGELHGEGGALRAADVGLYVGGGTGVAEALCAEGRVETLGRLGLAPAYLLRDGAGNLWEDRVSMRALGASADVPGALAERLFEFLEQRIAALAALAPPRRADTVVLAQSLGRWLAADAGGQAVATELRARWESERSVRGVSLALSTLRAAPALGAVFLAWREISRFDHARPDRPSPERL